MTLNSITLSSVCTVLGQPSSKNFFVVHVDVATKILSWITFSRDAEVDCGVEYWSPLEWDCSPVLAKFCKQFSIRFLQAKLGSGRVEALLSGDELFRRIGTLRLVVVGDVGGILHVLVVCVGTFQRVIKHFTGAPLDAMHIRFTADGATLRRGETFKQIV